MSELVAVYGSLLSGLGNHGLLKDSTFLGESITDPEFKMWDLGYYPGITDEGDTAIKIEVYEVDKDTFNRLDILEGWPSFYDRKKVNTGLGLSAWIYFLSDAEWEREPVESGDWRRHYGGKW